MSDELKRCPFCGGPGRIKEYDCGDYADKYFTPGCAADCPDLDLLCDSPEIAAEVWNTRADNTIPRAWWDELKDSLRDLLWIALQDTQPVKFRAVESVFQRMEYIESRGKRDE